MSMLGGCWGGKWGCSHEERNTGDRDAGRISIKQLRLKGAGSSLPQNGPKKSCLRGQPRSQDCFCLCCEWGKVGPLSSPVRLCSS